MSRRRDSVDAAPLRLAFYTPGLGVGGAERWVITLAAAFSSAVEVVAIFTTDKSGPLAREAGRICPVIHPDFVGEFYSFDVLIVWGCKDLAAIREKFSGRIICVSHGEPGLEWTRATCAAMEAVPGVELVAVSEAAAKSWSRPSTVIHNGVSVDRCMPRRGRDAMRQELGILINGKVALFLGRLSEEKRPEILLEALEYLPAEWTAVFAGPDAMGFSEKVCGNPRVRLLPPVEQPGDLLAAADVFVLPSRSEGMPLAVLEAMQAGKDIVCSNWGVADDLVLKGVQMSVLGLDAEAKNWAHAIEAAHWNDLSSTRARHYFTAVAMAQRWEDYLFSTNPIP